MSYEEDINEDEPETFSSYIDKITAWLERNGVRVYHHAHELPCAGLYRSETKQIWINVSDALVALVTLAHEAGHWLGYMIDEKPHAYQRERQAYVYGWYVLKWFNTPISRDTWCFVCRSCHKQFKLRKEGQVETVHLFRDAP